MYLKRQRNWKKYEKITAQNWMKKYVGNGFTIRFGASSKAKFGYFYNKVNMSWFWSKMITRFASRNKKGEEILGYLINSFDQLIEELVKKIEENGGRFYLIQKCINKS